MKFNVSFFSSKLFFPAFLSLLLFVCVAASPAIVGQTLGARLSFIISHWNDMESETDLAYETIASWIPESGVRGRYAIAKSIVSKNTLQGIVGEPVFLQGPHEKEVNVKSKTSFGYYNPAFIVKLEGMLRVILGNQAFVRSAQSFYDKNFKNYLRTFYLSYKEAANNQEVMDKYKAALAKADESEKDFLAEPSYVLQESFRDFSDELSAQGYDIYESFTCPGFWVRRSMDGTEDEFFDLLVYVMGVFDEGFTE